MSNEKETIRAQRRRRTVPAPGGRERAEAPQRETPSPPSGSGGTGGDKPPFSFPSRPGKPMGIGSIVVVLIILCAVAIFGGPNLLSQLGEAPQEYSEPPAGYTQPVVQQPMVTNTPQAPKPTKPAGATTPGQTWTVMLYQDADDKILEQDIYMDLNEAEKVGSTDRLNLVSQIDRYNGGFTGDGDWTTTARFFLTQDSDLNRIHSEGKDIGEVNMADPDTLVDFVDWAVQSYPADKYVLILSDHGMGWPGGWSDPNPGGRGNPNIPLSSRLGNYLYLMDLDKALGEIRSRTGIDQFELIGMDACLMGQMEVLTALEPHARYAVFSQEIEPSLGWAYTSFLETLAQNPDIDGSDLSAQIVESYIVEDQRVVDDQARAEFLRQGSPMGGLFSGMSISSRQLAQQLEQGVTISAIDLSALPDLENSLNQLVYVLQSERQQLVARARTYAQSFTNIFGGNIPPSYIDLGNFLKLIRQESTNQEVIQSIDQTLSALDSAVIAEKHGPKKPGATGIAIYFPNSQVYQSPVAGPESYTAIADRFASQLAWDDFLEFHYTGNTFEPQEASVAVPASGSRFIAPGTGEISISEITLSDNVAAPGKPVLMSADVTGENIGYIYFFTGFFDQASNSIYMADMDYLESTQSKEIDGVYYPVWSENQEFTLEFEWEPLMFAISDGSNQAIALLKPQSYGRTFEEAVYTVDGIYTYADSGDTRSARLYFSNGELRHVFGFTQEDGTGAPREIIPSTGDSFTVLQDWMDLDQSGNVKEISQQEGDTLVFGDDMFRWVELDAAIGQYVIGFIVEDLDGNKVEKFTQVTVE